MKFPWIAFLPALALLFAAARGEDAPGTKPPQEPEVVEVTVSPLTKLKLEVPAGWTKLVDTRRDEMLVTIQSPGDPWKRVVLILNFSMDLTGKLTTQQAVNGLVLSLAGQSLSGAGGAGEEQPLVVLKPKSGLCAYSGAVAPVASSGGKPSGFPKEVQGVFVTGGVVVKFDFGSLEEVDAKSAEFQQALKFIEEGITVE